MKFAVFILALLPIVFSNPVDKRFLLDTLFEGTEIKTLVDQLVGTIGTDATEQACEQECHVLIKADHLLQAGCPLVCKSFQTLVQRFGHHSTSAPAV